MRLGSLSQKCFESNTECGRCDKKGRCGIAASFEPGGRFGMAAAYRVAAPSIRIVPWAALASCWPLPQQLLPVSAAGGGRRRCTLAIFSGKIILNFGIAERLRAFRYPIFTERGVEENCRSTVARFPVKTQRRAARRLPVFVLVKIILRDQKAFTSIGFRGTDPRRSCGRWHPPPKAYPPGR